MSGGITPTYSGRIKPRLAGLLGGKDLSFCVGPQTPFINKNASEEQKMLGKAS